MINTISSVQISSIVPSIITERLREGNPLPVNQSVTFDGALVRLRLSGLESLASPQFISSIERLPVLQDFYATLLGAYTSGTLVEVNAHQITLLFPLEGRSSTGIIRGALVSTEKALEAGRAWLEANQRILKKPLQVKASATAGTVHLMVMRQGNWQAFLYGSNLFAQVDQAFHNTHDWELVTHRELLKKLGNTPLGDWRTPHLFHTTESYGSSEAAYIEMPLSGAEPTLSRVLEQSAETFLNPYLRQYLEQGRVKEKIQPAVCLNLQLETLSLLEEIEPERWLGILNTLHTVSERYGGYVDFTRIDATYSQVPIYFGILELEDNIQQRALACAYTLAQELRQLEPRVRMGVATAPGLAALVGTPEQRGFVILSDAINAARQLTRQARHSEILVEPGIIDRVGKAFAWQGHKLIGAKVYLNSLEMRLQTPPSLPVETEHHLDELIASVFEGAGRLLILHGGEGIMMNTLAQKWIAHGGHGYSTVGAVYYPSTPYQVWFPIWRAMLDLHTYDEPSLARKHIADWCKAHLPQQEQAAMIFQNLLGLEQQEPTELHMLEAATRQKLVFDALVALIEQHVHTAPLLLIFEQLEHIDSNSIDLLRQLPMRLQNLPVLICLSAAPQLETLDEVETLHFSAWSRQDAQVYLQSRLPVEKMIVAKALVKAENLPAEVMLLANLLENDVLLDAQQDLYTQLVNQFTPEERTQIAQRAVWGMTFPVRAPWLPFPKSHFYKLEQLGVTERFWESYEWMIWDRFRYTALREAFLTCLNPQSQNEAYQQITRFMQTYLRGSTRAALMVPFVDAAHEPVTAVQWHIMAGDHARRWGAEKEALEHYFAAEDLLEKYVPGDEGAALKIALLIGRANLYYHQQVLALGRADAELAFEIASAGQDSYSIIQSLLLRAQFHQLAKEYTAAAELAGNAIQMAQSRRFNDYIAQAMWVKAQSYLAQNRISEAGKYLQQATTYAQRYNTPVMQVSIALDAVSVYLKNYQRDLSREQIDLAIALGRELGDPGLLQKVWAGFGHVRLLFGEAEQASHAFEEAMRLTSPEGFNPSFLGHVLRDYGVALCYLGRYNDAESMLDTAQIYLMQVNDVTGQAYIDALRAGELLLDRQEYPLAMQLLDKVQVSGKLDAAMQQYVRLAQAHIHLRQQRFDQAQRLLTLVQKEATGTVARWYRPVWHLRMGELALETDRPREAVKHAYSALGEVGTQSDLRYLTPTYCLLATSLFIVNGASDSVMDAFQRAIKTGRAQARRLHLAQALQLQGNYMRSVASRQMLRAKSSGFLFEATSIFEEMGISPHEMWANLPPALV